MAETPWEASMRGRERPKGSESDVTARRRSVLVESEGESMARLFDISGKVAFVTGAGSGIGRDAARAYAEAGAAVALADLYPERAQETEAELVAAGHQAFAVQADVAVEASVRNAVERTVERFGRIDIVLNNAGFCPSDSVEEFGELEWNHAFAVNVNGIRNTSKYILPLFREQGHGKVVNIASVAAITFDTGKYFLKDSYPASKAAVIALTKTLAARYAKYGITVNAIGPGVYKSRMTEAVYSNEERLRLLSERNPSGRASRPGELNGAILFLSSPASDYVQGQTIFVDGGASLL